MYLTAEQVRQLLDAVEADRTNPNRARDHCAIFLGFFLGLRISEATLLCKDNFRDMHKGVVYIRTLKQSERIQLTCKNCSRRARVALARAGGTFHCSRCGAENKVPAATATYAGPPEKQPPVVERHVRVYIEQYMREHMRPDQTWFFEGAFPGVHISAVQLGRIFSHYLKRAGLPLIYSWHALRHGRGVMLYESFEDLVMVRDALRQKSTKTAEIYTHISPKKAAAAADFLDNAWNQAANPPRKP